MSWIPSEAVGGLAKLPFGVGLSQYDAPLPDEIGVPGATLEELREADRFRFCDHLAAWIDLRMPPRFQSAGIDASKEIRKRHPGTSVVILSQFDDPDDAVSLLAEGSAGYPYLLKDRIAEGDHLIAAIGAVATGGSVLDPSIVDTMIRQPCARGVCRQLFLAT
jgi:DNA-binding NarL/FixJ family response regulator